MNQLIDVFEGAKDLLERFQSEQSKDIVRQAMENVKDIAADVNTMYGIAQDAAEKLVSTLLIVGQVISPEMFGGSDEDDEEGAASRGVFHLCEVTQLDELVLMLKRDLR